MGGVCSLLLSCFYSGHCKSGPIAVYVYFDYLLYTLSHLIDRGGVVGVSLSPL